MFATTLTFRVQTTACATRDDDVWRLDSKIKEVTSSQSFEISTTQVLDELSALAARIKLNTETKSFLRPACNLRLMETKPFKEIFIMSSTVCFHSRAMQPRG